MTPVAIPSRIQAQDYVKAEEKNDKRNGATTGPCSVGEVDLGETSDNGGVCTVGWTTRGEWLEYTIGSNSDGEFDLILRLASKNSGKRVTVLIDGVEQGSVTGPAQGWGSFKDRVISKVAISTGEHTLRVRFEDGSVNFNYIDIVDHDPNNVPVPTPSRKFVHPGIFSTKAELDFVKSKIQANEEPWAGAFAKLKETKPHERKLNAAKIVRDDSKPTTDRANRKLMDEMTRDGSNIYAAALLWYFTGEEKYRAFAVNSLNAWSVFERGGMPLYITWAVPHFINAAEIMRHTPGSGWKEADIEKFSRMVDRRWWSKVQLPNVQYGSNHGTTANESMFAIAIFLDDEEKFNKAMEDYNWLMVRYVWLGNKNRMDGESNETCRDLNHMKLGMHGLMYAAEAAWIQGEDLWKKDVRRWELFTELHAGIMNGNEPILPNMCAWKKDRDGSSQKGRVYCKGNVSWASPSGRPPCNQSAWEILINHVGDRLNKSIPYTRGMAEDRYKGGITHRNAKWETLLKARVPTGLSAKKDK